MTSLHQLESAAGEQRSQVDKTLGEIKSRAQFPAIAHEAIGLLNLRHRGQPLIAADGIAGAVWHIKKFLGRKKPQSLRSSKTPNLK
jgi:hypothetical protein